MEQPNMSYINNLSGGDKLFAKKLIAVIKSEFPEEKRVYLNNFDAKNFLKAAENVHKLKHKISILGLEKSHEIASIYENELKDGNIAQKDVFYNILETMTIYLNQL